MTVKKNKGLGSGLPNFFGLKDVADVLSPSSGTELRTLPLSSLRPGHYQPRMKVQDSNLEELADSIRENGILNPIVVRKIEDETYEILAGERRFQAARLVGLETVPVTILEASDKQALVIGLVENLQREDLNVIESAQGVERLISEFSYTHEEAAKVIGRSRSFVSNLLRLLTLDEATKEWLEEGKIEMGHARALLSLKDPERQKIGRAVIEKALSVRQTEELVRKVTEVQKKQQAQELNLKESAAGNEITRVVKNWEKSVADLSKHLDLTIKLSSNSKGKGKLLITFEAEEQLEKLIGLLNG